MKVEIGLVVDIRRLMLGSLAFPVGQKGQKGQEPREPAEAYLCTPRGNDAAAYRQPRRDGMLRLSHTVTGHLLGTT